MDWVYSECSCALGQTRSSDTAPHTTQTVYYLQAYQLLILFYTKTDCQSSLGIQGGQHVISAYFVHFVLVATAEGRGASYSFLVNNVGSSTLHHNMKFPAFHHRKFQTQLFSLKPMTSSCHVRIVNEIDKRASQPASLLRRLWQLQGKNWKGPWRRKGGRGGSTLLQNVLIFSG